MKIIKIIKSVTLVLTLVCGMLLVILLCIAIHFPLLVTSPLLSVLLVTSAFSGSIWISLCWNNEFNDDCE